MTSLIVKKIKIVLTITVAVMLMLSTSSAVLSSSSSSTNGTFLRQTATAAATVAGSAAAARGFEGGPTTPVLPTGGKGFDDILDNYLEQFLDEDGLSHPSDEYGTPPIVTEDLQRVNIESSHDF